MMRQDLVSLCATHPPFPDSLFLIPYSQAGRRLPGRDWLFVIGNRESGIGNQDFGNSYFQPISSASASTVGSTAGDAATPLTAVSGSFNPCPVSTHTARTSPVMT